jgi:Polyketide cyclase / dehydrase and lipid transport
MSDCRRQTHIAAPIQVVWDLIADVERHPEWWPRVVEIECEQLGEGCVYRQVTQTPFGDEDMELNIDAMRDPEEFKIRCVNTGTFVRFGLTEARGGTFVDGRMGMEPDGLANRVFDAVAGRIYFRRWLAASLDAMSEAAERRAKDMPAAARQDTASSGGG